jgi:hypothetical protein
MTPARSTPFLANPGLQSIMTVLILILLVVRLVSRLSEGSTGLLTLGFDNCRSPIEFRPLRAFENSTNMISGVDFIAIVGEPKL